MAPEKDRQGCEWGQDQGVEQFDRMSCAHTPTWLQLVLGLPFLQGSLCLGGVVKYLDIVLRRVHILLILLHIVMSVGWLSITDLRGIPSEFSERHLF